jgi:hypothetical protein
MQGFLFTLKANFICSLMRLGQNCGLQTDKTNIYFDLARIDFYIHLVIDETQVGTLIFLVYFIFQSSSDLFCLFVHLNRLHFAFAY